MGIQEIKEKYQADVGMKVSVDAQKKSYINRLKEKLSRVNALKKGLEAIYKEMQTASDLTKCRDLEIKAGELLRGL